MASKFLVLVSFFLILGLAGSREVKIGSCILVIEEKGDCPDPDNLKVYLFTRKNKDDGQYVEFSETTDNITSSFFNPLHPNKLIIHGFNSDMFMYALMDIKAEYLKQEEVNIWMVNYPRISQGTSICYLFAVRNIEHVGHCLAQLITALRRHSSTEIHVIGFSLGAHVPNYIAEKLGNNKLDRITGLDPAGPMFTTRNVRYRLDPSDAKFVDVVHTNAFIQGIVEPCGHIDFYMNGGVNQPGCLNATNPFGCDHHRAPEYFAESIRTKVGFWGWQCEDYLQYFNGTCTPSLNLEPMGDSCKSGTSGFYVAYTAAEKPFALGNWTGDTYKSRAPKISFTKLPTNLTSGFITKQQTDVLQRILYNIG